MEKFLLKKSKKYLKKIKVLNMSLLCWDPLVTRSSNANLKDLAPSKRAAIQKANTMLKPFQEITKQDTGKMNILQRCILDDEGTDNSFFHCMSVLYPEIGAATGEEFKGKVTSYIAKQLTNSQRWVSIKHMLCNVVHVISCLLNDNFWIQVQNWAVYTIVSWDFKLILVLNFCNFSCGLNRRLVLMTSTCTSPINKRTH